MSFLPDVRSGEIVPPQQRRILFGCIALSADVAIVVDSVAMSAISQQPLMRAQEDRS